jgi:phenylacetic acid degradation protein/carnitine operon protein CaiE
VIVEGGCYRGAGASLHGDFGAIRVGDGSNVQDNWTLEVCHGMTCMLKARAHVGHGAHLLRNVMIA